MAPTKRRRSARELELLAASSAEAERPASTVPSGEVMAMLVRRGFRPESATAALPFPEGMADTSKDRLAKWLGHYAFRLFLRGAIQKQGGFLPRETTRYLSREQSERYARLLAELGMAEKTGAGRFRLKQPVASFGGTLEWYVARELRLRYGFDAATGVKLHVRGAGGDLDVVAAAEGKLFYLELKSSPPRNLAPNTAAAFWNRVSLLRPDLSLFVVDTALRLSDKILPMLVEAFPRKESDALKPERIGAQLWALTPHVYAVNGHRDLMANIGKAVASGLRSIAPGIRS